MTENEINKVIAEFMGDDGFCYGNTGIHPKHYTKSLDALVPVWEKMDLPYILELDIRKHTKPHFSYRQYANLAYKYDASGEKIQLAAAQATAMAIKELNK